MNSVALVIIHLFVAVTSVVLTFVSIWKCESDLVFYLGIITSAVCIIAFFHALKQSMDSKV